MTFWRLLGATVAAGLLAAPGSAGPVPIICIRDPGQDPTLIRSMFDSVDRQSAQDLDGIRFTMQGRDGVPTDDFLRLMNFNNGREDGAPLRVVALRKLVLGKVRTTDISYVVETRRSEWFGSDKPLYGGYVDFPDTWLVSFQGCGITSVRESPELHYLVDEGR